MQENCICLFSIFAGMELGLHTKRALVCGASDGIGKATALMLAAEGARVTLLARNAEKLKAVLDSMPGEGHQVLLADMDFPESVQRIIQEHIQEGNRYDILVNNSGGPASGPLANARSEEFLLAFNRHLICGHILAQALLPGMKEAGYGRIINIISTSVKAPLPNLGVSNTIRGAVASWAKTLANENAAWGITVNNVLPGATLTGRLQSIMENKSARLNTELSAVEEEMRSEIPMKRFAGADEIAAAVTFLASEKASYITGINVPVDGGRTPNL